jgi:cysteine-S-conjugate beta-lyase
VTNPFTALSLAQLRTRRSVKWRTFEPDVLPMWVAEMDTPLAPPIAAALARAVTDGDTGYAHPGRLAEAFAGFARRRYGWSPDPARAALVPDVVRGLIEVLRLTGRPGDGVVVNMPAYPPFFSVIAAAGRRVIGSPLGRTPDGGYRLDLDRLERDLTEPDVAAYVLCNPHNPTGLVLNPGEVAAVAALANRYRVRLLADEIHAPLTYPGVRHTALATVDSPAVDDAIAFVSASKAFNLPGLKAALAIALGDAAWELLRGLPAEVPFGAGILGVLAGEAAFDQGDEWLATALAGLDHNRWLLAELLAQRLPAVGYRVPHATFLAWLDLRALGLGDNPAEVLLRRGRVALSPGPAFGAPGHGHARLNFATSPELLDEGVRRLAAAVNAR